jgi:hypothetical protein
MGYWATDPDGCGERGIVMIAILVVFAAVAAAGASLGIVAVVSIGIHREHKATRRLTPGSPGPVASGARAITGLGVYRANATWD